MLNLKTSGNVVGDQRTNKFITRELQDQLDGMLLADAAKKGLISPETFEIVNVVYHGNDGEQSFSRMELKCKEGNVIVSESLTADIANWANRLGDLTFKRGVSNRDDVTEYFRLSKPGGGVTETRTISKIGQKAGNSQPA